MHRSLPGSSLHGDSPSKTVGVGFLALLQGIFPTQGWNPGLPYCRQILYHLSYQGSPNIPKNDCKLLRCGLCAKAFDCVDHNKLWKILKEMGIPDHLTCLLRSLYAGQEATVRTEHATTDWFQIGKRARQGCILLPCLFHFYADYIMRNAGLEETQARIKIAGRNINHLRYADDTTLMAESEEKIKSLLMKVKEESEKDGLKLNIQKTKIMAPGPVTLWEIDGETVETVTDFILGGSEITADGG